MARFDVVQQLEDLAEWFDNPKLSPITLVKIRGTEVHLAASTMLREIASELASS